MKITRKQLVKLVKEAMQDPRFPTTLLPGLRDAAKELYYINNGVIVKAIKKMPGSEYEADLRYAQELLMQGTKLLNDTILKMESTLGESNSHPLPSQKPETEGTITPEDFKQSLTEMAAQFRSFQKGQDMEQINAISGVENAARKLAEKCSRTYMTLMNRKFPGK